MQFEVSEAEAKLARHPHEVFLINLITNHILLFIGLLGLANSKPMLMLIIPAISLIIISYIMLRARAVRQSDSWFAMCHWQLCVRRSKMFIIMLALMAAAIAIVLLVSGGHPKPQHLAIGGAMVLPTMVTVLVLIVMESDAMHQAKNGLMPKSLLERYPNPDAKVVQPAE